MNLIDAIRDVLATHASDDVLAELDAQHGAGKVNKAILANRDAIVHDIARLEERLQTRRVERYVIDGDGSVVEATDEQFEDLNRWRIKVPLETGGWAVMRYEDCTASDLDRLADRKEKAGRSMIAHALWLRERADQIRAEGVGTFGELRGVVPPLPQVEEPVAA